MLNDFISSLDFLAAVLTIVYIGKLLVDCGQVAAARDSWFPAHSMDARFEKRSLLNQEIRSRFA